MRTWRNETIGARDIGTDKLCTGSAGPTVDWLDAVQNLQGQSNPVSRTISSPVPSKCSHGTDSPTAWARPETDLISHTFIRRNNNQTPNTGYRRAAPDEAGAQKDKGDKDDDKDEKDDDDGGKEDKGGRGCTEDKRERASEDNKGTEDDEMADVELARDG
ncbi:hypothetical protein K469DRAFT_682647 [Zopfia rhizophila CBS 207.26]|uniref:Uncharacterized protein n=1 Tax=Zopfia rhizophila CBS 207.26 TaxID=1314779 RepID=A0A6A6DDD9_9PEZI|nr:hypothetical protein K469DRAFT_682647 [Zopfia rhizophila CBS 207.26]